MVVNLLDKFFVAEVADGHELTPLLKKVCEQIGFDPKAVEHEPQAAEWGNP